MNASMSGTHGVWHRDDEYETHPDALRFMASFLDREHHVVWEPFWSTGFSGDFLRNEGFAVVHEPVDFFALEEPPAGVNVVVTNPPFSKKREVFERLFALEMPFVLLVPTYTLHAQYFQRMLSEEQRADMRVVFPQRRIKYLKAGVEVGHPSFDSVVVAWGVGDGDTVAVRNMGMMLRGAGVDE